MLEEAEKRDHRRLGRELDLFHAEEAVGFDIYGHGPGHYTGKSKRTCAEDLRMEITRR